MISYASSSIARLSDSSFIRTDPACIPHAHLANIGWPRRGCSSCHGLASHRLARSSGHLPRKHVPGTLAVPQRTIVQTERLRPVAAVICFGGRCFILSLSISCAELVILSRVRSPHIPLVSASGTGTGPCTRAVCHLTFLLGTDTQPKDALRGG